MQRVLLLLVSTCALVCVVACGDHQSSAAKPVSEPGEKLYQLRGTIVSHDAADNSLNIDHQAIPGFMEAMKMDYAVRGATIATLPPDGSRVEAKLHVTDDHYWITDVKKAP
ncbi:MAG: electron transporter SenC [Acidobacteria bacterium]|nr:electron transporter SenC [Acidobacteriota bacterium]